MYVAYVFISYDRIDDKQKLKVNEPKVKNENVSDEVNTGVEYTIGTYNVGFGAYLPDYSFLWTEENIPDVIVRKAVPKQ